MHIRSFFRAALATAEVLACGAAIGQDNVFKIGLILPMTGQLASTGRQIEAAARLYMQQNGDTVAGKKIQLILKDDTSLPDVTRRLAQELVVNDKVNVLAGFGITPSATATAPIATQSKTPEVVMAAATSSITEASPNWKFVEAFGKANKGVRPGRAGSRISGPSLPPAARRPATSCRTSTCARSSARTASFTTWSST